jgi:hypothetical protein
LSDERKLSEKNAKPYSNNVLFLYVDSVSRSNALRKLKKTLSFFEKFMPYEGYAHEKYPNEKFHSFQFFKYQSFRGYTGNNYQYLFFGRQKTNKLKKPLTKYFKDNGYLTSLAFDYCKKGPTRLYHKFSKEEFYDFLFPICDPNNEHFSSTTIRCLYGKQNSQIMYDYTEQFWRKYQNNRKFSMVISLYGHEGTTNVVKYIDDVIYNFLNNLFNDNLLKDTSVFLVSDHGVGMPSVYYIFDFYPIELHLPMLFILVNDRKNVNYEKQYYYMHENQQNYITHFDTYNTIGNILYGDKYNKIKIKTKQRDTMKTHMGASLFSKITDVKNRTPNKYILYNIDESICK